MDTQQLTANIAQAITDFNNNRFQILQLAFQNGGQNEVTRLEQEYDALRDAYFEIIQAQLDKNNHLYDQLTTATNTETDKLKTSIAQLNNINNIINLLTSVVNLIGRSIITLGI